jgi:3' exoribonuclease, RNase T-like
MEIYYDTEFLEDGRTIGLISIGMVADDGREYYAVTYGERWLHEIGSHEWLLANVVPSLPVNVEPCPTHGGDVWNYVTWDRDHPDWPRVQPRRVIANEVRDFILATPKPDLWAWYGAYDHVALCQLWGAMTDLPEGVPMWTNDLKQECERLGNPALPALSGITEHNALDDAREVRFRHRWLKKLESGGPR